MRSGAALTAALAHISAAIATGTALPSQRAMAVWSVWTARNCSPSISSEVDRTNLFPLAKRRRPCLRSPRPTKASNPRGADTSNDSTCHGPGDRCTVGFQSPLGLLGTRSPDEGLAGSVPQSKRDDDIGRFGLVYFQTRPALVAPTGQIHDHGGIPGRLDRLNDVEPVVVEEECVFAEQVVELPNQGVAVGNGPGFELPQSSLELCRVEFHCALLSFAPKRCALLRFAGASHHRSSNATRGGPDAKLGHPARPT